MIDKLEYLLALAREQHFGRAAEACGISQPTLSAAVKQLEETLGVLLVVRGSRFQGFTPEGQRVLDWGRRIVSDTRAMRDEVRASRTGLSGHLRIAAVPTALASVVRLIAPFHARHPDVSFSVLSRSTGEILAQLENLELDAALGYVDAGLGRMRTVPLYNEEYCLVVPASHPLAARESVEWPEVAKVPLCLLTPDMQNRQIVDTKLRAAGLMVAPMLESDSIVALLSHVQAGQWGCVLPAALTRAISLPTTIRPVPIVDTGRTPVVGLIYPLREPLTPLVTALVAEAHRHGAPAAR
jgi:DNA-binding transcriptional LysR family regulator